MGLVLIYQERLQASRVVLEVVESEDVPIVMEVPEWQAKVEKNDLRAS